MNQVLEPLWIVHDDPGLQNALARLVAPASVVPGPPEAGAFDGVAPAAVILAVPGRTEALERALQFAYEVSRRHADVPFVIAHDEDIEASTIADLFAGLRFASVSFPPDREEIFEQLARLQQGPRPDTIGARRDREALLTQATAQLGGIGLEPIELARKRAVLVRGGAGTARLLLARTVHALADDRSAFFHIGCGADTDPDGLRERIQRAVLRAADERITFCLDGIDALPRSTQREVRGLIELGVPGSDPLRARWIGLAARPLARELRLAFEGSAIELPGPFTDPPASISQPPEPVPLHAAEAPLQPASPPSAEFAADSDVAPRETPADAAPKTDLGRVALTLAHELRNPLVPMQMLAALSARDGDPDHDRLREQVQLGIDRIENVLERLTAFSAVVDAASSRKRVDLSQLLERLLQERRDAIQERRLLVMRHLESEAPEALGDEEGLTFAFETLLDAVMDGSRERGDLYIASRHHPSGLRGGPAMRVLLRFHGGPIASGSAAARDVDPRRNSLDWMLAEEMVRRLDGTLTIEAAESEENVVDVYLPAPAR